METAEELAEQIMRLPVGQRLTIAQQILASMDDAADPNSQSEWEEEIRARIAHYDRHPDAALDGPTVLSELDQKLGG